MATNETTTAIIPAGQRVAQFGAGRTITLSDTRPFPLQVTVKRYKPSRSDAQRKLAWLWADHIANEMGETKEYIFGMFKYNHLAPIMARDSEVFAREFEELKEMISGYYGSMGFARVADNNISSSKSTTVQMSEAMQEWEMVMADGGIVLPRPDDYLFAMQIESYAKI